jgi:muramoyltetrapeptide carboxypeptidase
VPGTLPYTLLTPPPIAPGQNIRVVSPASPTICYVDERLERAEQTVRDLGFEVSYGANVYAVSADGARAGTPRERAEDLMAAFADPEVAAIFCADAGEGSVELLPHLDPALIRANPKPFIGYSDNVFLNQYLLTRAGLVSYYGYTFLHHMGEVGGPFPETLDGFLAAVASTGDLRCEPMLTRTTDWYSWIDPDVLHLKRIRNTPGGLDWIRPGRAEGPLIGAALPLLPEIVDLFELRLDGAVLFWDVNLFNEVPIRTLLTDLMEHTDLTGLAGMVVGANQLVAAGPWAREVAGLLDELLPGTGFPVLVNADLSHLCPSWLVPYGAPVTLGALDGLEFHRTADKGANTCASSI